jgi:hypothetical protein
MLDEKHIIAVTHSEALKLLEELYANRGDLIKRIDRKHKWLPSEKAMAKFDYYRQRAALRQAIDALKMGRK